MLGDGGCCFDVGPHITPSVARLSPGRYALGFAHCSGQWPVAIASLFVYRLSGTLPEDPDALAAFARKRSPAWQRECGLDHGYPRDPRVRLSSDQSWILGDREAGFSVLGPCPPLRAGSIYKLEVTHVSVSGLEVALVRIGDDGTVTTVWSDCERSGASP